MTPKRIKWIAAASTCAVILAVAGWMGWSHRIADDVTVSWADRPSCTGTTVVSTPLDQTPTNTAYIEDIDDYLPSIRVAPKMRCTIGIRISNNSTHSVRVKQVIAAWLGPDSGAQVKAGDDPTPRTDPADHRNVLISFGEELGPGEAAGIAIPIVYRPDACAEDGGRWSSSDWPKVDISVLGRTVRIHAGQSLSLTTVESDC